MAWLRKLLVDDAILGLMRIDMVVSVEDCADFVLDEQLVNRHRPAGTLFGKNTFAIGILAAPLVAIRAFDPTAAVFAKTTNEVVDEDKLIGCLAVPKGCFKPFMLFSAECVTPVILVRATR